ncbi:hypothetical protein BD410DRAFT_190003 [Rickenella mellea]|uniref:Uncharacterized protein n=1 Tax=Rickenella mellea TaxID=50990 RepID=A0A4Y7Q879_9AGAM|nr:hypothetical protein BD410DRAFT_190003 [Rickenella mellea]
MVTVPFENWSGCFSSLVIFKMAVDPGTFDRVLGSQWLKLARRTISDGCMKCPRLGKYAGAPSTSSLPSNHSNIAPLFCFHSTPVINRISVDALCSFYHVLKISRRGAVNACILVHALEIDPQPSGVHALSKYIHNRRFDLHNDPSVWLNGNTCGHHLTPLALPARTSTSLIYLTFGND